MADSQYIPRYAREKTVLRGRIHQIACFLSIAWLLIYIIISIVKYFKNIKSNNSRSIYSRISKILILSIQIILYGCSALYHRASYNKWLQRIDHFCIFLFISSVHTSVLLGMLQSIKEKKKTSKKEQMVSPTASDLQFKLHPNPFSINSPMRNSKNNQCCPDLTLTQDDSAELAEKNNTRTEKCFDTSQSRLDHVSERYLTDNSFFDCSIQKSRHSNISDHKDQEKAVDPTSITEKTILSYDSKNDPSTDLSANLSALSSNSIVEASLSSDNITDEKSMPLSDKDEITVNKEQISLSEAEKKTCFDDSSVTFDKIDDNRTFKSETSPRDLDVSGWSYTHFTNRDITDIKGESYDSSLDTTLTQSQTMNISQSEQRKCKNRSENHIQLEEKEKSRDNIMCSLDRKCDHISGIDERIDIKRPLIVTWLFCTFGLLKILLQRDINELLDVPLYILHGAHIVFTFPFRKLPRVIISSFISGGVCYILGGIFFGFEFPNFNNSFFGYHEFFHVMTVMGNICFLLPIIFNLQLIE